MSRRPARARRLTPEAADQQADLDLEFVLSSPQGRRAYWQIVVESGAFASLGCPAPQLAAWLEGRRDIGVYLIERADRIDPSLVPLMMQEKANAVLEASAKPSPPSPDAESVDE